MTIATMDTRKDVAAKHSKKFQEDNALAPFTAAMLQCPEQINLRKQKFIDSNFETTVLYISKVKVAGDKGSW